MVEDFVRLTSCYTAFYSQVHICLASPKPKIEGWYFPFIHFRGVPCVGNSVKRGSHTSLIGPPIQTVAKNLARNLAQNRAKNHCNIRALREVLSTWIIALPILRSLQDFVKDKFKYC